ncbi:MAG: carbohydrate ABC transporter permease [Firmicutes bacterium]|nr:carbohydrate ABC transporter permease [Bacillota bacterium]
MAQYHADNHDLIISRPRGGPKGAYIAHHAILILISIVMMLPYVWMVGSSFKAPTELSLTYFTLLPKEPTLQNFVDSVRLFNIGRYFYNSVIVSGTAVLLQTTVCALAAYALARFQFPGAGLLLVIFIGTMMVPEETIMVPLFLIFKSLGLLNTYGGMILPIVPWGFSVYLLTQFFREIPHEIEESAYIDGASHLTILLKIILPLSKPALGAIFIFSFLMTWDQMVIPLIVVSEQKMATLPLALANMIHEAGENHTLLAASTTLATIPSVAIFVAFQRYFISGLTAGAVKG